MLLRLWEPILWRALKVANPLVRAQATNMLADAFPLTDAAAKVSFGRDASSSSTVLMTVTLSCALWQGFGAGSA